MSRLKASETMGLKFSKASKIKATELKAIILIWPGSVAWS